AIRIFSTRCVTPSCHPIGLRTSGVDCATDSRSPASEPGAISSSHRLPRGLLVEHGVLLVHLLTVHVVRKLEHHPFTTSSVPLVLEGVRLVRHDLLVQPAGFLRFQVHHPVQPPLSRSLRYSFGFRSCISLMYCQRNSIGLVLAEKTTRA